MSTNIDIQAEEQSPQRPTLWQSFRRDAHIKCLMLTLVIMGCMGTLTWCHVAQVARPVVDYHKFPIASHQKVSPCDEGYVYIPIVFMVMLYVVYLVECWHCTTRLELIYKVDSSTVYQYIRQMRESQPMIWWKAICYHYVRRTRQVTRYRNGDPYTTNQIYYERINSHSAASCFVCNNCGVKDISKNLTDLESHPATKIRFSKGFAFASIEAANEFEEQRMRFFQENHRVDDYMEMREGLDLLGVNFQEYMVAFADADQLPWYVSHMTFWAFSLFLLSWPLRVLMEWKTAYVHYQVNKLFGINYLTPSSEALDRMSRVSTVDSSEIERHIADGLTLAPSYSEAVLFDSKGNVPVFPVWLGDSGLHMDVVPVNESYGSIRDTFHRERPRTYITGRSLPVFASQPLNLPTHLRRISTCPRCFALRQQRGTPPSYEDVLLVSRPLRDPLQLRRSATDMDVTALTTLVRTPRSCSRLILLHSMETTL